MTVGQGPHETRIHVGFTFTHLDSTSSPTSGVEPTCSVVAESSLGTQTERRRHHFGDARQLRSDSVDLTSPTSPPPRPALWDTATRSAQLPSPARASRDIGRPAPELESRISRASPNGQDTGSARAPLLFAWPARPDIGTTPVRSFVFLGRKQTRHETDSRDWVRHFDDSLFGSKCHPNAISKAPVRARHHCAMSSSPSFSPNRLSFPVPGNEVVVS